MTTKNEWRLAEILKEEIGLYQNLLKAKEMEKEALLGFSTRDLEITTSAQEKLANRARDLESERRRLVRELVSPGWDGKGEPRLGDAIGRIAASERERLRSLGETLSALCDRVAKVHGANAQLIGTSAGYIQDLLESLLERTQPDAVTYGRTGKKAAPREARPSLVDQTF